MREYDALDLLAMEPRFWSYVDMLGHGGCWEWTGAKTENGYGTFRIRDRTTRAHRISYTLCVGDIPDGLQLDHLCRNRACVNPAHLEAVTQRENILRGTGPSAANVGKRFCPAGHEYTDANTYVQPKNGKRRCRTCHRIREGQRHALKRAA